MKHLTVTISAELEIPDDWEVVDHPCGTPVLRIGDQFVDFDIAPLATRSADPEAEWSDADTDLVEEVLDTVVGLEADLDLRTHH